MGLGLVEGREAADGDGDGYRLFFFFFFGQFSSTRRV